MKFAGNLVFFIWMVHLESPPRPQFSEITPTPFLGKKLYKDSQPLRN